jgi:hypothetical protein
MVSFPLSVVFGIVGIICDRRKAAAIITTIIGGGIIMLYLYLARRVRRRDADYQAAQGHAKQRTTTSENLSFSAGWMGDSGSAL